MPIFSLIRAQQPRAPLFSVPSAPPPPHPSTALLMETGLLLTPVLLLFQEGNLRFAAIFLHPKCSGIYAVHTMPCAYECTASTLHTLQHAYIFSTGTSECCHTLISACATIGDWRLYFCIAPYSAIIRENTVVPVVQYACQKGAKSQITLHTTLLITRTEPVLSYRSLPSAFTLLVNIQVYVSVVSVNTSYKNL